MASLKYYRVERKVNIGGNISLTDYATVAGCNEQEAIQAFIDSQPSVQEYFGVSDANDEDLNEYWRDHGC